VALFFLILLIGKCAGPTDPLSSSSGSNLAEYEGMDDFGSTRLPPTNEGFRVPVGIEPNVEYRILKIRRLRSGNLEVLSRRDGPSGTSFARREYNCDDMTFRYLGEGDTREDAEKDAPNRGSMADLIDGSSAFSIGAAACVKGPM
jgi:hypothetical protein